MILKHITKLAPVIGLALTFALVPVATADLWGTDFSMVSEYTDSPFLPGGSWNELGSFTVGNGTEWTSGVENVYDYSNGGVIVGWIQYELEIGADYIELTTTWQNTSVGDAWSFLSLMPGEFYGYHLNWDIPTNIASAALSVTGNPVNMGDLNLYEGDLEAWVDSYIMDPQSDERITITENGLDINMQGIAWEYWNTAGNTYSETARIDFTFIPAPSAFALLGIAGFCRRRRS